MVALYRATLFLMFHLDCSIVIFPFPLMQIELERDEGLFTLKLGVRILNP